MRPLFQIKTNSTWVDVDFDTWMNFSGEKRQGVSCGSSYEQKKLWTNK